MRAGLHRTRLNLGSPKVSCSRDGEGRLRHVEHMCEPVGLGRRLKAAPTHADLKELAQKYLGSAGVAAGYDIEHCQVHLDTQHEMRVEGIAGGIGSEAEKNALRLAEIKSLDSDSVLTVSQSYAGLEVWQAGFRYRSTTGAGRRTGGYKLTKHAPVAGRPGSRVGVEIAWDGRQLYA